MCLHVSPRSSEFEGQLAKLTDADIKFITDVRQMRNLTCLYFVEHDKRSLARAAPHDNVTRALAVRLSIFTLKHFVCISVSNWGLLET
jgi:hypothetical protein